MIAMQVDGIDTWDILYIKNALYIKSTMMFLLDMNLRDTLERAQHEEKMK